jgi:hypothetical protein
MRIAFLICFCLSHCHDAFFLQGLGFCPKLFGLVGFCHVRFWQPARSRSKRWRMSAPANGRSAKAPSVIPRRRPAVDRTFPGPQLLCAMVPTDHASPGRLLLDLHEREHLTRDESDLVPAGQSAESPLMFRVPWPPCTIRSCEETTFCGPGRRCSCRQDRTPNRSGQRGNSLGEWAHRRYGEWAKGRRGEGRKRLCAERRKVSLGNVQK